MRKIVFIALVAGSMLVSIGCVSASPPEPKGSLIELLELPMIETNYAPADQVEFQAPVMEIAGFFQISPDPAAMVTIPFMIIGVANFHDHSKRLFSYKISAPHKDPDRYPSKELNVYPVRWCRPYRC